MTKTVHSGFAARASNEAKNLGLTQTEISKECGVTPQSVQRWFSGDSLPRPHHLPVLAKMLQCSVGFLISDTPELASGGFSIPTPLREESPLKEINALRRSTEELSTIASKHQIALAAASEVCGRTLLEQLGWHGYFQAGDIQPTGSPYLVSRDGHEYSVELRMHPPSVADTARMSRATTAQNSRGITAYAWYSERVKSLRFFIAPDRLFLTRQGVEILKMVGVLQSKIRAGILDLSVGDASMSEGEYLDVLFGEQDRVYQKVFEWVDLFELEEAVEATKHWDLIRSK